MKNRTRRKELTENRKSNISRMDCHHYFYHGYVSGDWHCAYVLLYGPRVLKIDESQNGEEEKSEEMEQESKTTTDAAMETS